MDQKKLYQNLRSLCEGETDLVTLMATVSCEVYSYDSRCSWTGFYRVVGPELLKVGPYQGGHGCLRIPFNRGVCGAAARSGKPQLVGNVETYPDHIACSSETKSELVLPVYNKNNELIAVFDLDSEKFNAFSNEDVDFYEGLLTDIFGAVA